MIHFFYAEVQPQADALTQQAMLVLSLGSDLEAAFPAVRQAVRIPPLFHYTLTQAVAFADGDLAKADAGDKAFVAALKPLLYRNPKDRSQDESFSTLRAQRDRLFELAERMETARLEIQEASGFGSSDGRTLKAIGYYPKFEPGRKNAIEVAGDEWELVQVHEKFTYHPPLSGSAVTDKSAKPILKDEHDKVMPMDGRLLASFLVNGLEYELHANETEKLTALSQAMWQFAFSREMQNLAEGLEAGAMFMMDVIELVPGVGQEVMAARMAAQTAAFVAAELPMIVDAVKKDPVEFILRIGKDLVNKYLTLDGFITFVLLGQGGSPLDLLRKPEREKPYKTKPHGKLGRLIALLRKLGMRLADAVQWLQLRVAGPVRSLQSSVATRPKLGWVLRKAVDIALWARDVVPPDIIDQASDKQQRILAIIEQLLPGDGAEITTAPADAEAQGRGLIARIEAEVAKAGEEFKEQLEARLELLRQAELPGEIVPLESLIVFVLDFFLSRLGAKVRIAKKLLENTDAYKQLQGTIAHALADEARGTAVDPNKYWREYVLDSVEGQFVEARNQLVDTIYGLTDRVADETGINAFRLARPGKKAVKDFGIQKTGFPQDEIELAKAETHSDLPPRGRLADLPATAGQPLAVRVRVAEEARFGHDFRHVRLHNGQDTGAALKRMRADAATSGSHVFLRPGLQAERGDGARLLRHELTHVLQQTGPRPVGRPHEVRAVPGRPRRGINIDAMREAAAEAMARADERVAREPVNVQAGAEGVQPSLEGTAVHLLEMFTEAHSVEEFEKGGAPDKDAVMIGTSLLQQVRKRLSQKLPGDFLPFARPVAGDIAKHVDQTNLTGDLPKVAALAQKPIKGARGKKPKTELDFGRFVTLFEAVLFARTGIAMQLKAKESKPPVLEDVRVTYVHLGWIAPGTPGSTPLWDQVIANTPKLVDGDDPKLVRLEIHARLQVMGPDPFIWKTGENQYRFSDDFVEAFAKLRARRKPELAKNLPVIGTKPPEDPKDIPKFKNEYLNPTGQSGVGLRIGLHGGHIGLEKQAGTDRESHHMVQYLLVQFFRNDNRVKAWRGDITYPGLKRKSGSVHSFESTSGTLQLQELDKGGSGKRGSSMPAILIAADTHRRGQVHVERETQWKADGDDPDSSDNQGRATQGFAIHSEFKRQQIKYLGSHDDASDWNLKMQQPANADLLRKAMIGTYHWMYGIMMPALDSALQTRERAYYRAVASRIPKAVDPATGKLQAAYDLDSGDLAAVFARAQRHTNQVMADAGWPAP
jgi:hypothetical protein